MAVAAALAIATRNRPREWPAKAPGRAHARPAPHRHSPYENATESGHAGGCCAVGQASEKSHLLGRPTVLVGYCQKVMPDNRLAAYC